MTASKAVAGVCTMNDYTPIELVHKAAFDEFLRSDPPQISELTFTNLYMWRRARRTVWRVVDGCLLIILWPESGSPYGLPPVGRGDKQQALEILCSDLRARHGEARICRADKDFVEACVDPARYTITEDRDNSDYIYLADELIKLPGNRLHGKKNFVNRFLKNYSFEYKRFDDESIVKVLELQESWCELRECFLNPTLHQEDIATREAVEHFRDLGFTGGAILIDGKVEAFSFGEKLNPDTAVIHMEKANPEIPGLYAAINQIFCEREWSTVRYINREQDLGVEGLRKAKLSYHPHHLVEKFTILPK